MGKVAKILPQEFKEKAIKNNIPLPTVYRRIRSGWNLDDAVMTKTQVPERLKKINRIADGSSFSADRPRTTPLTFYFYDDLINDLEEAVKKTGLSRSEFLAVSLEQYLQKK